MPEAFGSPKVQPVVVRRKEGTLPVFFSRVYRKKVTKIVLQMVPAVRLTYL